MVAGFGVSVMLHGSMLAMAMARHGREGHRANETANQPVVVTLRVSEPEPPVPPEPPLATRPAPISGSPTAPRQNTRTRSRSAGARLAAAAPPAVPRLQPDEAEPVLTPSANVIAAPVGVPGGVAGGAGSGTGPGEPSPVGPGNAVAKPAAPAPRIAARPLLSPHPVYPHQARLMGWEGVVVLRLLVDAQGGVAQVTVATGSGFALLDEAAVDAAHHWRFAPAREGDRPIAMVHEVRFRFRLDNATG